MCGWISIFSLLTGISFCSCSLDCFELLCCLPRPNRVTSSLRRRANARNVNASFLPYGSITYLINSFDYPNLLSDQFFRFSERKNTHKYAGTKSKNTHNSGSCRIVGFFLAQRCCFSLCSPRFRLLFLPLPLPALPNLRQSLSHLGRRACMAQWISVRSFVTRVRFPYSPSHVLVLTLLQGVFSGTSGFPPSTKTNTSKFQCDLDVRASIDNRSLN